MEVEHITWKNSVREGYVVLLRAEAELLLPIEQKEIRAFYEKTARACLMWESEIWGEQLRERFCALDTVGRARFHPGRYRFFMRIPWEQAPYACILCESSRTREDGGADLHRICHWWHLEEQTALPKRQILQLLRHEIAKNAFPFSPDGIFKEKNEIVIFKNPTSKNAFLEAKLPVNKK